MAMPLRFFGSTVTLWKKLTEKVVSRPLSFFSIPHIQRDFRPENKFRHLICIAELYTSYIYMEDDTYLEWVNLLSWAADEPYLNELNFTRGFYRVEVRYSMMVSCLY